MIIILSVNERIVSSEPDFLIIFGKSKSFVGIEHAVYPRSEDDIVKG